MLKPVKRLLLAFAFVIPIGVGLTIAPAMAASHSNAPSAKIPQSNLKAKAQGDLIFKPKTLNVTIPPGGCVGRTQFVITNTTMETQEITLDGSPWDLMTAGKHLIICTTARTATFGVEGSSTAVLTVHSRT